MANSNEPRKGTAYVNQVNMTSQASQPFHAVRNDDPAIIALRNSGLVGGNSSTIGFVTSGYPANVFGNKDPNTNGHGTVPNGNAVLINAEGNLAPAYSSSVSADNTFALKANDKYYLPGMIAFNYSNSLVPGRAYWLQLGSGPAMAVPSQAGEWAVKVGIALTSTDMLVLMDVQGQIN